MSPAHLLPEPAARKLYEWARRELDAARADSVRDVPVESPSPRHAEARWRAAEVAFADFVNAWEEVHGR